MKKFFYSISWLVIFSLQILFLGEVLAQEPEISSDYTLVSKKRINRTITEFTFKASLVNHDVAIKNVSAVVTSSSPYTVIIGDGRLNFDDTAANETVVSNNTIIVRQNRTHPFNPDDVRWVIKYDPELPIEQRVFNTKITPDEFFTNEPSIATISAEVLSVNLSLLSVIAYKTDKYGNVLSQLGQMYDNGTHGDLKKTDSIFTTTINVNEPEDILIYVRVVVTYEQDPNQYLSSIMEINFFKHISHEAWLKGKETLKEIKRLYLERLSIMSSNEARKLAYQDALNNPNIKSAVLHGVYLSILFKGGSRGFRASVRLDDSTTPIDASGEGIPSVLPKSYIPKIIENA